MFGYYVAEPVVVAKFGVHERYFSGVHDRLPILFREIWNSEASKRISRSVDIQLTARKDRHVIHVKNVVANYKEAREFFAGYLDFCLHICRWNMSVISSDKNERGFTQRHNGIYYGLLFPDYLLPDQSVLPFDLLNGFFGLRQDPVGEPGINNHGEEGSYIKTDFPKWRLVMAALAVILATFWRWLDLRRERREIVALTTVVVGLCLWGYAVYGFLIGSFFKL